MRSANLILNHEVVNQLTGIDEQTRDLLRTIVTVSETTEAFVPTVVTVDGTTMVNMSISMRPAPGQYSTDPVFNECISVYQNSEARLNAYKFNLGLALPLLSEQHSQFYAVQDELKAIDQLITAVVNRRKILTIDGNFPEKFYGSPFKPVPDCVVPGVEFEKPKVKTPRKASADFDLPYANDIVDTSRWENVDRVPPLSANNKPEDAV